MTKQQTSLKAGGDDKFPPKRLLSFNELHDVSHICENPKYCVLSTSALLVPEDGGNLFLRDDGNTAIFVSVQMSRSIANSNIEPP
jgi:hypothetical protein